MAYKCFVTTVQKIVPIPNADNIQTAIVLGNQVVVGKNVKVGDLGLFFPADCQLSEDFCKYNNLFRDSTKNIDQTKQGFFDGNRRVRCQPFMKVKSEGYFCGIESLDYMFTNSILKVHYDEIFTYSNSFDKLFDKEICRKYISLQTQRRLDNQAKMSKGLKAIETPMFHKHVNTDQFDYYVNKIPKGALLSFHAKIHGCFPATQLIMMWDGSKKNIKDVQVGDIAVGYKNDEAVPSEVTNTFDNGKETCWVDLEYSRSKFLGNNTGKVRCTTNHKFLTEDGEYVEAALLTKGCGLVFNHKCNKPSKSQIGAYLGMLLGDGYLSRTGNLQFSHKEEHFFIRPEGNSEKDTIIKERIFWDNIAENFNVQAAIDDRPCVVSMWNDIGIPCVIAVADQRNWF